MPGIIIFEQRLRSIRLILFVRKAGYRRDTQGSGIQFLEVSARSGEGLDELKQLLKGKFTCFAGQSAVGKSTLLNAISPALKLETGEMSRKTARGRHTTRHSELLLLPELEAVVADTPGFSIL